MITVKTADNKRIVSAMKELEHASERPSALVGFDGYIDKMVRLHRTQGGTDYFSTVREFSDFISSMGAMSADIAVHRIFEKIGGNGPLLAEALADKGIPCVCIGAMGQGEAKLHPKYQALSDKVDWRSVTDCASSFAMEFDDGKLMFGDAECFYDITWDNLCRVLGREELTRLFREASLLCFANWSGLPCSTDLLNGILTDIAPVLKDGKRRSIFFDLADPSGKTEQQFAEFFSALEQLGSCYHTVVGLNPKECLQIYNRFYGKNEPYFDPAMGEKLLEAFPADEIALHVAGSAYVGRKGGQLEKVDGRLIRHPKISVGAGDNFNSGYCLGMLLQLPPAECAALGNESAVSFMERGKPVSLSELIAIFH